MMSRRGHPTVTPMAPRPDIPQFLPVLRFLPSPPVELSGNCVSIPAPPLLPSWEQRFPGRQQFERDQLTGRATNQVETIRDSLWVVTFDWAVVDERIVRLEATFPDTYPYQRPHVRLLSGWEPRPTRHVSPQDGNICLIGRASNQWTPGLTLAQLLDEKLFEALSDTGEQDPQAEPADYWWNQISIPQSYCLVDSSWKIEQETSGSLDLLLNFKLAKIEGAPPVIKAVVAEVRAVDGSVLASWAGPLPQDMRSGTTRLTIPWARVDATVFPEPEVGPQLGELQQRFGFSNKPHKIGRGMAGSGFAVLHNIEGGNDDPGMGWIFAMRIGQAKAFQPQDRKRRKQHKLFQVVLPVMRAGQADIGLRVPAYSLLRDKAIAVFGLGAIGAPLAIDLARNGVKRLHLVEHDIVEPGNTVRWPLGADAWGQRKVQAIADFIAREYPATEVLPHQQAIGAFNPIPDSQLIASIVSDVDLVIDGTAAWGVTQLLEGASRAKGVPLIQFSATPTLWGGTVVRYSGMGGCPVCLEHVWNAEKDDVRRIERAPGAEGEGALTQPPGCAERTFTGGSFDLGELSLQAVRLAISTLETPGGDSIIQTLSLADPLGNRILPVWREEPLPKHSECSCGSI